MNTLKTVVVIAVLAIVGYGLYIGLNNGFEFQQEPPPTPDWIANEIAPAPSPPSVQFGEAADAPAVPSAPNTLSGSLAPPGAGPAGSSPVGSSASLGSSASPPLGGTPADATALAAGTTAASGGNTAMAGGALPPTGTLPLAATPPASALPGTATPGGPPGAAAAAPNPTTTPAGNTTPGATGPGVTAPGVTGPTATSPVDSTIPGGGLAMPLADEPVTRDTAGGSAAGTAAGTGASPVQTAVPKAGAAAADTFTQATSAVKAQLDAGQLSSALLTLSIWYEDPRMAPEQHSQLVRLLDQVAGTVIYSRKHLMEGAYRVQSGETLTDLATRYNVPAGLLAKINGVAESTPLQPGQELKIIRGPFNAVINSKKQLLTLWLHGHYAGRFNIHVGPEFEKVVGSFVVQDKIRNHNGNNGHGWIGLGSGFQTVSTAATSGTRLGIAGMQSPENAARGQTPGRIGVSVRDADDLFDILSRGSKVTIAR